MKRVLRQSGSKWLDFHGVVAIPAIFTSKEKQGAFFGIRNPESWILIKIDSPSESMNGYRFDCKTFIDTPPKINIEPENDGLGRCFFLSQGCILRVHVSLPRCKLTDPGFHFCPPRWVAWLDELQHSPGPCDVSSAHTRPPKKTTVAKSYFLYIKMSLQSKGMQSTVILHCCRTESEIWLVTVLKWFIVDGVPKRVAFAGGQAVAENRHVQKSRKKRVYKRTVGRSLRIQLYPWWVKTWKLISISGSPEAIPFVPNITYKMS